MSSSEIGQIVMANDFVKEYLAKEPLKGFIDEINKGCLAMIANKSRDEILKYTSDVDLLESTAKEYLAMDSTKRRIREISDEMVDNMDSSQAKDTIDKLEEILRAAGETVQQFDEMVRV